MHKNPFNDRCIHGKDGVRMAAGRQECNCEIPPKQVDFNEPEYGQLKVCDCRACENCLYDDNTCQIDGCERGNAPLCDSRCVR